MILDREYGVREVRVFEVYDLSSGRAVQEAMGDEGAEMPLRRDCRAEAEQEVSDCYRRDAWPHGPLTQSEQMKREVYRNIMEAYRFRMSIPYPMPGSIPAKDGRTVQFFRSPLNAEQFG